jgi:molybdate transport system ATP-binding protein
VSPDAGLDLEIELPLAGFDLALRFATGASSVGIFGPSGAGKTSVLEAVAGWRDVPRGRIRLGGRTLLDTAAGIRVPIEARGIGYVPQDALLFPHRTVRGNLASGRRRGAERAPRIAVERVLEVLEIGALLERSVQTLSGGERQRVALARALCSQPDFLLLDEPFGSLELPLRRRILPYLIRVREAFDLPTLFVSHDPTEVQALCDEVAVLERGRVVARGEAGPALRAAAGPGAAHTNVLRGAVGAVGDGTASVSLAAGVAVQIPETGLAAGERVVFAIGAEDVLVARERPVRISARNVLAARVAALREGGADVRVDADVGSSVVVSALLTPAAARELELAPGADVHLVFKTRSCRLLSR